MTTLTFEFDDEVATRVIDGLADHFNYAGTISINSVKDPEPKIDFVKRRMCDYMLNSVAASEGIRAAMNADRTARDSVKQDIQIR